MVNCPEGRWNENLIRATFNQEDYAAILRTKTAPSLGEDFIAWHPEKSGRFTVKSAYKLAVELTLNEALA
ncbi:hypothetical protein E2562_026843 [Oryza meyeriana var. granulata]|uniref:Uncharacterized protein n=1 Tax=Oryza meyeriana var. granulata TaxID=110450 RepID=A0A6G1D890_9ORYZ|nr:hypothetical protein E2562_026843 [Oryza meyeriana var. granulata]